jgi:hypothetical protein
MKVAAALLQIRLLRQMTGGDEAGMPPAMAAALRDCGGAARTSLPGRGCGGPAVMGHFDESKHI